MTFHVGKHFIQGKYDCAHYVAQIYREKINVHIPVDEIFERRFVVWIAKHFKEVLKPSELCLVIMTNIDDSYHIGIHHNYGVYHNFKPQEGNGSVCYWEMSAINKYYKRVRFYKWSS